MTAKGLEGAEQAFEEARTHVKKSRRYRDEDTKAVISH